MRLADRIAFDVIFAVFALVFTIFRLLLRYRRGCESAATKSKTSYVGDVCLLIGATLTTTFAVRDVVLESTVVRELGFENGRLGGGMVDTSVVSKVLFEQYVLAAVGACALKACLCLYYAEMLEKLTRRLFMLICSVLTASITILIALVLWVLLRCHPLSKYWAPTSQNCYLVTASTQVTAGLICNLITDFLILSLGLYLLIAHNPKALRRYPIGITIVFFLGCSVITLHALRGGVQLHFNSQPSSATSRWKSTNWTIITTAAELGITCVLVSLPPLLPHFRVRRRPTTLHHRRSPHLSNSRNPKYPKPTHKPTNNDNEHGHHDQRRFWNFSLPLTTWPKPRPAGQLGDAGLPPIGILTDAKECGCGRPEWEACEWGAMEEEIGREEGNGDDRNSDIDGGDRDSRRDSRGGYSTADSWDNSRGNSRDGIGFEDERERWSYDEQWSKRWSWKDWEAAQVAR